jgi:hypothetical protein
MKTSNLFLILTLILCLNAKLKSQNPYDAIGKKTTMLTLTKGKYPEYVPYDSIQRIGSIVINIRQGKVIEYLNRDALTMSPEVSSRWWATDPLSTKYPDLSPYNFCGNNPILFIDPNGKEIGVKDPETGQVHIFKPGDKVPDGASKFVADVYSGLNYLHSNPGKDGVNRVSTLVTDKNSFTIQNTEEFVSNRFSGSLGATGNKYDKSVLSFNNGEASVIGNGLQSPVVTLAHEIDHAFSFFTKLKAYDKNPTDANFEKLKPLLPDMTFPGDPEKLKEENRATKGYETTIAKKLGQGTRTDYSVNPTKVYATDNIFSTKESTNVTPAKQEKIDAGNKVIENSKKK